MIMLGFFLLINIITITIAIHSSPEIFASPLHPALNASSERGEKY